MHPTTGESPLVYFDNSALSRLTDPDPHLLGEADNMRLVVRAIAGEQLRFLSSSILFAEISQAPPDRQRVLLRVLNLAWACVPLAPTEPLARQLLALSFRRADALHVAAAYTGQADYLLSYDARHFLRRAPRVAALIGPGPAIVTPEECLRREGLQ